MYILDRYILKTHIPPYLFSLTIITFVFIMDFIIRYLDMFIDKGVSFFVVLEFFVLSLGHMFALIIPMSVMPATLMAFGQFAAENEVTAMKATGVSLYRMIAEATDNPDIFSELKKSSNRTALDMASDMVNIIN